MLKPGEGRERERKGESVCVCEEKRGKSFLRSDGIYFEQKVNTKGDGRFFQLEAGASGNDRVQEVASQHAGEYFFFANEVPYLSEAREVIVAALKVATDLERMGDYAANVAKRSIALNQSPPELTTKTGQRS